MEKPSEEWTPVDRERVLAQLARILGSRTFSTANRLQRLLKYLVSETVAGRGHRLNQASIAIDVLERDEKFDPAVDSVVRVEAGRLRSRLRDYYIDEGRSDPVRIELPKGLYRPKVDFVDDIGVPETGPRTATSVPPMPFAAEKRPGWAIIAILAVVLTVGVFIANRHVEEAGEAARVTSHSGPRAKAPPAAYDGAKSLAVLPFSNSSAATEDAGFFADGLHDDLLTQLTKIADLKVISRTSVMGYRGEHKPIPQIAEELGVHAVVEGAVQRAGNRVRVNVQLIDGRTDKHIWAESFDQELTASNVFEIQRRIAVQIAGALKAELSPQERNRLAVLPTDNFQAYEAYLKARQRLARRTIEDMRAAAELFKEAVELDPDFALAHVGIAEAAFLLNSYAALDRDMMMEIAQPALDQAFAINEQIGEAWAVRAGLLTMAGDDAAAERAYQRSIALNPNYAQAYHWYSTLLATYPARIEEQLQLARRARELDPLSSLIRVNLAFTLESMGRFDEAEAELRRALEIDPGYPMTSGAMGILYLVGRHNVPEAMRWLSRAYSLDPGTESNLQIAEAYLVLGDREGAKQWIESYRKVVADGPLRELLAGYEEYLFGNRAAAADRAQDLLNLPGKFIHRNRRLLLQISRDDDLRNGRPEQARARYGETFPGLLREPPEITRGNMRVAVDLALVLQKLGQREQADRLLDGAAALLPAMPRLGTGGYALADVEIAALRGNRDAAIAALRAAVESGWLYYWVERPDENPNLALLHDDPEYRALMDEIKSRLADQAIEVKALEKAGQIPMLTASSG